MDMTTIIHIFTNGVIQYPTLLFHAVACGSMISKRENDDISIIEKITLSDNQVKYNKASIQKKSLECLN